LGGQSRFGSLTKLERVDRWMDRNGKGQIMSCCKSLAIPVVGYDNNNSCGFSCWLHHSSQWPGIFNPLR
jgi:hypothetical protein